MIKALGTINIYDIKYCVVHLRLLDHLGNIIVFLLTVTFVKMFCEKAVELIRELHRMGDGQLPAFNVSV